MKFLKKLWPVGLLLIICSLIYYEFVFKGKVPLPADTLVGAYFPWLDYKWGFTVGVPVKNALTSDAFSTFFVWKKIIIDMYSKGVIPLWNKYSLSGTPLLATFHSTVFHPANLLLFLPKIGWSLYIFLSSVAAALSMYLFLGNYVKSKMARIVGSLIFAFSGPMTTWAEFGTAVWAASVVPLMLHFIRRQISKWHSLNLLALSLLMALLIFSGHVQLLTYAAVIVPLFLLATLRELRLAFPIKVVMPILIALLLGVGIGAIQLLPAQDFVKRSIRSDERYASSFNYGLSSLSESIRLFAADFFGHPTTGNHYSPASYHEYSSYMGALALPLIFYFLISFPLSTISKFFALLFAGSLVLAFDNPISRAIFSLPLPLLTYSSASRIFFVTNLASAFLVASSLDKIRHSQKSLAPLALTIMSSIILVLLFMASVTGQFRSISLRNSIPYLGILFICLFSLPVIKKYRALLVFVILAIFAFDLGRYFNKYNTFVKQDLVFPVTPIIEYLQKQPGVFRIARENTSLLPPNTWAYYGLESIEGYDPLYSIEYGRFFHVSLGYSYEDGVSRYAVLENVNKKYLDALNVKYFLTVNPKPDTSDSGTLYQIKNTNFKEVFRLGRVSIYENPDVVDRAFFAEEVLYSRDNIAAFQILSRPDFDPRTTVVIQEKLNITPSITGNIVKSIEHQDGWVRLMVHSDNGGFLVLSDSFDPGWKVKINGLKGIIYKTDVSLMGVVIEPGDSIIEFNYLPDGFVKGAIISASSLVIIIALFVISKIIKRHET